MVRIIIKQTNNIIFTNIMFLKVICIMERSSKMHGYGNFTCGGRYEGRWKKTACVVGYCNIDGSKYEGTVGQNRQFEPSLLDGNEYGKLLRW